MADPLAVALDPNGCERCGKADCYSITRPPARGGYAWYGPAECDGEPVEWRALYFAAVRAAHAPVAQVATIDALTDRIVAGLRENHVHLNANDRALVFNLLSQAAPIRARWTSSARRSRAPCEVCSPAPAPVPQEATEAARLIDRHARINGIPEVDPAWTCARALLALPAAATTAGREVARVTARIIEVSEDGDTVIYRGDVQGIGSLPSWPSVAVGDEVDVVVSAKEPGNG